MVDGGQINAGARVSTERRRGRHGCPPSTPSVAGVPHRAAGEQSRFVDEGGLGTRPDVPSLAAQSAISMAPRPLARRSLIAWAIGCAPRRRAPASSIWFGGGSGTLQHFALKSHRKRGPPGCSRSSFFLLVGVGSARRDFSYVDILPDPSTYLSLLNGMPGLGVCPTNPEARITNTLQRNFLKCDRQLTLCLNF